MKNVYISQDDKGKILKVHETLEQAEQSWRITFSKICESTYSPMTFNPIRVSEPDCIVVRIGETHYGFIIKAELTDRIDHL